ncbi:transmembrane protein, putative [Ixodes scapularis]|uniref:Transmembrane protein, putative n=1 Tax=Ixodes scapularis TaxID=6945 RepID=B7P4T2_IXOSC|nr:transmembrane protein, putative [Ixodes scapularis]|eukprot:XP_002406433.1 transmembrane protein, putative [Ixodes scapularis]
MIEVCSLKRIIFLTVFLIGACLMILTLESILSDHDGNHNMSNSSEGCWEREDYVVKQKCVPCTEFERVCAARLVAPGQTRWYEVAANKQIKDVCSCENENEAQRFWIFEGSVLVTGLFSSLSVVFRRKHLDRKMMERIQQQVAAGV